MLLKIFPPILITALVCICSSKTDDSAKPAETFVQGTKGSRYFHRRPLECVDMIKTSGIWRYQQVDDGMHLCAIYMIADPDEVITVELTGLNLNCRKGEFIEIFDGWLAGGSMLPDEDDHLLSIERRRAQACSNMVSSRNITLKSSQNFCLVQFKLYPGRTFELKFGRTKIEKPCNVISPSDTGKYTLATSDETKINCTFSMIYPSKVTLTDLSIGLNKLNENTKDQVVTDKIAILNGNSLSQNLAKIAVYEGPVSLTGPVEYNLTSRHAAVKLFSSGNFENGVTVNYSKIPTSDG